MTSVTIIFVTWKHL